MKENCPKCTKPYNVNTEKFNPTYFCVKCYKKHTKLSCTHCKTISSYVINRFSDKYLCNNPECQKEFYKITCPHCKDYHHTIHEEIYKKRGKTIEGDIIHCKNPKCNIKGNEFQFLKCPHCIRFVKWKDVIYDSTHTKLEKKRYKDGMIVICPFKDCKKRFQEVICPNCIVPISFLNANKSSIGVVYICPHCKNKYQHVNCREKDCFSSVYFKNAKYSNGQIVKCVNEKCKKSFYPSTSPITTISHFENNEEKEKIKAELKKERILKQQEKSFGGKFGVFSTFRGGGGYKSPAPKKYEIETSDWVKKVIDSKKPFVDKEFPHNDKSINLASGGVGGVGVVRKFDWARITSILGMGISLFGEKFELSHDDVRQGALGNCWFLSPLETVAQNPFLINKIFLTKDINPSGIYELQFCKNGEWKKVVVDDYFPVISGSKSLAFCRPKGRAIWVLLIEKAYAKLHGSYGAIQSGFPWHGLSDVSGFPIRYYNLMGEEKVKELLKHNSFFGIIYQHYKSNHSMILTSGRDYDIDPKYGIAGSHCYSILNVYPKYKVMRVRNPWAKHNWKGDWNRNDYKNWTNEARKDMNYDEYLAGSFYISWKDMKKIFVNISVCFINEKWYEKRFEVKSKDECFVLDIKKDNTEICIGLHQEDIRWKETLTYLPIGFALTSIDEKFLYLHEGMEVLRTHHSVAHTSNNWFFTNVLSKGKYKIFPLVNYDCLKDAYYKNHKRKIMFSLHCSEKEGKDGFELKKGIFEIKNFPIILMNSKYIIPKIQIPKVHNGNKLILHKYSNNAEVIFWIEWKEWNGKDQMIEVKLKIEIEKMTPMFPPNKSVFLQPMQKILISYHTYTSLMKGDISVIIKDVQSY